MSLKKEIKQKRNSCPSLNDADLDCRFVKDIWSRVWFAILGPNESGVWDTFGLSKTSLYRNSI